MQEISNDESETVLVTLPPGPATYEESLNTIQWMCEQYVKKAEESSGALPSVLQSGIIMATDYSGCGTPEFSSEMVAHVVQQKGHQAEPQTEPQTKLFHHYRACESEERNRMLLAGHAEASRPEHILVDILERVDFDVDFVKKKLETAVRKMQCEVRMKAAGIDSKTDRQRIRAENVKEHGGAFANWLWDHLAGKNVRERTRCETCRKNCRTHPTPKMRRDKRYVVVGGNICTSWSILGSRFGWLHFATIVYLVFLRDVKAAKAEVIIGECAVNFDHKKTEEFLEDMYVTQSFVHSPTQLGLPTRRAKKYTISLRKDKLVFSVPWSVPDVSFVFRRPVATARMFFRAPASLITKHMTNMAMNSNLPNGLAPFHYLCAGSRKRLEAHKLRAASSGARFLCANIRQSDTWFFDHFVPAMTFSSTLIWGLDLATADMGEDNSSNLARRGRLFFKTVQHECSCWPCSPEQEHGYHLLCCRTSCRRKTPTSMQELLGSLPVRPSIGRCFPTSSLRRTGSLFSLMLSIASRSCSLAF